MPQAINIVIKNDAAVDKTFDLATPSSGNLPAVWLLREGANQGVFPKVEVSARKNGNGDARKVQITLQVPFPVTDSTGIVRKGGTLVFNIDAVVPDLVPDPLRDTAIAYVGNLLQNTLIKETIKVGFAPA